MIERAKANGLLVSLAGYRVYVIGATPLGLGPKAWSALKAKKNIEQDGSLIDFFVDIAAFPLSTVVSSIIGSTFVAIITGGGGGRRHLNWHNIWIAIVNGGTFGLFGGIIGGLLCTFIYRLLRSGQMPHTRSGCAFDTVQAPLYWIGLVSGFVIAILTISTFGGAPIWRWRLL